MVELTGPLRNKLRVLAETKRLEQIQKLISDENYAGAVNAINDLNGEILSAGRACSGLATKIAKRHWSPLLDGTNG